MCCNVKDYFWQCCKKYFEKNEYLYWTKTYRIVNLFYLSRKSFCEKGHWFLCYPGLDFVEVCRRGSNFVNKLAIIYLYWAKLNFWTVQFCNIHIYDNFFASRLTLMMIRRFAWGNLLRSYEVWQHSIALNKRLCMCRQVLRIINDYLMNQ